MDYLPPPEMRKSTDECLLLVLLLLLLLLLFVSVRRPPPPLFRPRPPRLPRARSSPLFARHHQVPLPFPCCTSRQIVYRRVVTLLSPIECSIDDIGSRIVVMRDEVQAGIARESDTRDLTRLVQGSVLPQVFYHM